MVVFRNALHSNAINERIIKTHRYKYPAFIAVTVFLRHPDSVSSSGLCARPGIVKIEAALSPKKPRMLLAEPN